MSNSTKDLKDLNAAVEAQIKAEEERRKQELEALQQAISKQLKK